MMETNEREKLIERIKDDMRKRSEVRKALINVVNTYHCDMSKWQTFDTHTECYTEIQMIEMIAAKFNALLAAAGDQERPSVDETAK